jgi:hypothetical protein
MFGALLTLALVIGAWWFNSARPAGEPVRAGLSLPDLPWSLPQWTHLLNPLRAIPFRLSSIDFVGLEQLKEANLARSLELEPMALIDLNPVHVCERLLAAQPRVKECSAARMPPDRIVIAVTERKPIAVVAGNGVGIDAAGISFALARGEGAGLPQLSGDVQSALAVLLAAHEMGVALGSIDARRPDDVVALPLGTSARLRIGAEPRRGLQRWLALLQTRSLPELGQSEVDTRFRGQVILRERGTGRGQDVPSRDRLHHD